MLIAARGCQRISSRLSAIILEPTPMSATMLKAPSTLNGRRREQYGWFPDYRCDFWRRWRFDLAQANAGLVRSAPGRPNAKKVCDHCRGSRPIPKCGAAPTLPRRREAVLAE